jgi:hypothetical protein
LSYDTAVRAAGLLVMLATAACTRDPAAELCPQLAAGDLVVTEIRRGPQSSADTGGSWVEIYNASGHAIDLLGLRIRFRDVQEDEDAGVPILVRRSLEAAPGSYTVLGLFADTDPPPHVDYGFLDDFSAADRTWVTRGLIYVESCGARIDASLQFEALPGMGTFSLGGAPDANRNDLTDSWCTDATQVGTSFPGTPRSPNITCPPP